VPLAPPAPDLTVDLETAPDDVSREAALAETPDEAPGPQADAPGDAPAERVIPELDHPIGTLAVLDHLLDSEEPQTVAQILAALPPGTTRNTAESAIKRCFDSKQIERTSPGTYRLAPPTPPEPAKPAAPPQSEPVPSDEMTDQDWLDALERWLGDSSTWDIEKLGPRPDSHDNRISLLIRMRFADRLRKREERRKDRQAAAARQAAADDALRNELLAAANGNFQRGSGLDDLVPVREVLKVLPLDRVPMVIRQKVDRR
jgi:hypothetical protein